MNKKVHLTYGISAVAEEDRSVYLTIAVTNHNEVDYHISAHTVMQHGLIHSLKSISGPSVINCIYMHSHNVEHEFLLLSAGSTVQHTLLLSDFCNFSSARPGVYNIMIERVWEIFRTSEDGSLSVKVDYNNRDGGNDEDVQMVFLSGQCTLVIEDNSEDIALKSLTYESGL